LFTVFCNNAALVSIRDLFQNHKKIVNNRVSQT